MPYITATPNPVGVYSATWGAWARFEWDVQDRPDESRASEVLVSINGAASLPVQGPGYYGIFIYRVKLPNFYEFILRYADTKSEITRVEVQTFDLRTELATGFASSGVPTSISQSTKTNDGDESGSARIELPNIGSLAIADSDHGSDLVLSSFDGTVSGQALPRLAGSSPIQLLSAMLAERPGSKDGDPRRDLAFDALDASGKLWSLDWPDYPQGAPADRWKASESLRSMARAEPPGPAKT